MMDSEEPTVPRPITYRYGARLIDGDHVVVEVHDFDAGRRHDRLVPAPRGQRQDAAKASETCQSNLFAFFSIVNQRQVDEEEAASSVSKAAP